MGPSFSLIQVLKQSREPWPPQHTLDWRQPPHSLTTRRDATTSCKSCCSLSLSQLYLLTHFQVKDFFFQRQWNSPDGSCGYGIGLRCRERPGWLTSSDDGMTRENHRITGTTFWFKCLDSTATRLQVSEWVSEWVSERMSERMSERNEMMIMLDRFLSPSDDVVSLSSKRRVRGVSSSKSCLEMLLLNWRREREKSTADQSRENRPSSIRLRYNYCANTVSRFLSRTLLSSTHLLLILSSSFLLFGLYSFPFSFIHSLPSLSFRVTLLCCLSLPSSILVSPSAGDPGRHPSPPLLTFNSIDKRVSGAEFLSAFLGRKVLEFCRLFIFSENTCKLTRRRILMTSRNTRLFLGWRVHHLLQLLSCIFKQTSKTWILIPGRQVYKDDQWLRDTDISSRDPCQSQQRKR